MTSNVKMTSKLNPALKMKINLHEEDFKEADNLKKDITSNFEMHLVGTDP